MINIQKITIREDIKVPNEEARINLKKLLADVLKVKMVSIEMRFETKTK